MRLRWISSISGLLLAVSVSSWAGPPPHARPPMLSLESGTVALRLTADRLNYLPQQRMIRLSGKVGLRAGPLLIHGRSMAVFLDRSRQPIRVEVEGFGLTHERLGKGTADKGVLDLKGQHVWLSGRANLAMGPTGLRLEGQRIFLDLRTSKLVVHQARATLASEPQGGQGADGGS